MIIGGKAMPPEKSWNTNDLDFDENGQLIIKNPSLKYYILEMMGKSDPDAVPNPNCDGVLIPQGCAGGQAGPQMPNPNCETPITAGCGDSGKCEITIECLIKPEEESIG